MTSNLQDYHIITLIDLRKEITIKNKEGNPGNIYPAKSPCGLFSIVIET